MSLGELLETGVIQAPKRRFTMTLLVGADSKEELYRALVEIEKDVIAGTPHGMTASPSVGYRFYIEENESMTHERYFEELDRWLEKR